MADVGQKGGQKADAQEGAVEQPGLAKSRSFAPNGSNVDPLPASGCGLDFINQKLQGYAACT